MQIVFYAKGKRIKNTVITMHDVDQRHPEPHPRKDCRTGPVRT